MIWKPGDRAVICYRPVQELSNPPLLPWTAEDLSTVGKTGTVKSFAFEMPGYLINPRVKFKCDSGEEYPGVIAKVLAPIIEDPYTAIPKGETVHA